MWSIIQAAGWPIWPLILASIIALALIFERLWSLRISVVAPPGMVDRVLAEFRQAGADPRASREDRLAGAARAHPRRRARQREGAAPGHEGSHRGSGTRGHARPRAVSHHPRHDRRGGAAARPARHGDRHDRDLRLADDHRVQSDPARPRHLDRALQHGDGHHRRGAGAHLLPPLPRQDRRAGGRDGAAGDQARRLRARRARRR